MALPDFVIPSPEDDHDVWLLQDVAQYGWHIIHVDGEGSAPGFAFTVGLYCKCEHPELLVMGLSQEAAHGLLNVAVVHIVGGGERFEPYRRYDSIAEGMPIAFVPIKLDHYGDYLGYANWFYSSLKNPYPALQMVWPDREGRFPGDAGYDMQFTQLQKRLDV